MVRHQFSAVMLGVDGWQDQPPNAYERVVLTELKGLRASWHKHEQLLPRLPQILPQLLRTLRDADATLGDLTDIVARDPALVAAVTRTVNSAYFRTARPVGQLRDAVLLMGQDGLRRLLPMIAMQPIFHANGGRFCTLAGPHVWAHAQRCALAGMVLADGRSDAVAFEHYLAGLALGASLIVVVRTLDAQQAHGMPLQSAHFVDEVFHESHGLAVKVAGQWGFPGGTIDALQSLYGAGLVDGHRTVPGQTEYIAMVRALTHGGHLAQDIPDIRNYMPDVTPVRLQRCYSELLRFDEAESSTGI